jgi:hypothetical protein
MSESHKEIIAVIDRYFDGTFRGDVETLRSVFDPRAVVAGEVNGQPYYKPIDMYLAGVASRESPEKVGQPVQMELIAIDVVEGIASAKLHVRMLGFNYYNFFSLIRQVNEWKVIMKTLTNVKQ